MIRYASIKLYVTADEAGDVITILSGSMFAVARIFSAIVACWATKSRIIEPFMSLCAGSNLFGALIFLVDAGSRNLISKLPHIPGSTGNFSNSVDFLCPEMTLSNIGK